MARMQTGAIGGLSLQLVSETLSQHSAMTGWDESTRERVREVLNHALREIVTLVGADRELMDRDPRESRRELD